MYLRGEASARGLPFLPVLIVASLIPVGTGALRRWHRPPSPQPIGACGAQLQQDGDRGEPLPTFSAAQLRHGYGIEMLEDGKVRFLRGGSDSGCVHEAPEAFYGHFDAGPRALGQLLLDRGRGCAFVSFHRLRVDLLMGRVRHVAYDLGNGRVRYHRENRGAAIGSYDIQYVSPAKLSWALRGHRFSFRWAKLQPAIVGGIAGQTPRGDRWVTWREGHASCASRR